MEPFVESVESSRLALKAVFQAYSITQKKREKKKEEKTLNASSYFFLSRHNLSGIRPVKSLLNVAELLQNIFRVI